MAIVGLYHLTIAKRRDLERLGRAGREGLHRVRELELGQLIDDFQCGFTCQITRLYGYLGQSRLVACFKRPLASIVP